MEPWVRGGRGGAGMGTGRTHACEGTRPSTLARSEVARGEDVERVDVSMRSNVKQPWSWPCDRLGFKVGIRGVAKVPGTGRGGGEDKTTWRCPTLGVAGEGVGVAGEAGKR